ncbi:MAG TPA: ATP-dependent 6-phosphofructokinase [Thermoanaerobaculaceae bacterium]|nr:ATP-dependent 6-phosphofructokinase [Thermoanaerobaculaceae bacterium]
MSGVRRVGVLTGGGDAPGLNAVIRAVVRSCEISFGVDVVGISEGFIGLVENKVRELDLKDMSGLLVRGGTILGTTNRGNPFNYAFRRPDGVEELIDASATVKRNVERLGLDGLIVIGGDGSLSIGERLHRELGIPVVGVPKTIDNDLSATDFTFGFATALESATSALDRLHTTAESHHRVMLLEVMGREAGWIALHAGLAGGGDVVLIPEIPYRIEPLIAKFRARERRGKLFSLVVVAEGAAPAGGSQVFVGEDAVTGWKRLGGISYQIAREIEACGGYEVRATVLGHIQRGGIPVPVDRILATRFGVEAARLAASGDFGNMVALRGDAIVSVPLASAIGHLKKVDPDGQLVRAARAIGVVFGDEDVETAEQSEG